MEKIKLRKIYGTPVQKVLLASIILVSGLLIYLSYAIIYDINNKNNIGKVFQANNKITEISNNAIIKLEFEGEKKNTRNLTKDIAEVTYDVKGTEVTHFVNIRKGTEVEKEVLIKDTDGFNKKIHELLLLAYPSKIVEVLEKSPANYTFREKDLYIKYDISKSDLETKREFYLIVDNNEIKEYLDFPVELNETYENMNGFNHDKNKMTISLTFDDGPNGDRTKTLIKNLEDYKMSATFFMLGSRYESNADIVKLVYNSHSEVGYHNYNHNYYTKQDKATIIKEFNLADASFNKITGDHIKLTRPPYGALDKKTIEALPTGIIRWNLDTNDWRYKDIDVLVNYVLDNMTDGSIVLFHDSYETSIEAATILMEKLYLMDVQVVNVSELADIQGETIEPHVAYFDFR